jgi:hypothetical protein
MCEIAKGFICLAQTYRLEQVRKRDQLISANGKIGARCFYRQAFYFLPKKRGLDIRMDCSPTVILLA